MLTGRKWPHADLLEKEKEKEKQGRKEKAKRHSRKNYIYKLPIDRPWRQLLEYNIICNKNIKIK